MSPIGLDPAIGKVLDARADVKAQYRPVGRQPQVLQLTGPPRRGDNELVTLRGDVVVDTLEPAGLHLGDRGSIPGEMAHDEQLVRAEGIRASVRSRSQYPQACPSPRTTANT